MRHDVLPEPSRREAARSDHGTTGGERGERRGDETVDVEERHRHVGHVRIGQRIVAGHRAGGGDEIALEERHLLGPARRAARVQQDRDVLRPAGLVGGACELVTPAGEPDVGVGCSRHLDDPGRNGRIPRPCKLSLGNEQEARLEIAEIEGELIACIRGVERGGSRAESGHGQQQLDDLRTVRQSEGDAVAVLDARRAQASCEVVDTLGQLAEGQDDLVVRADEGRGAVPTRFDHSAQRLNLRQHRPSTYLT